MSNFLGTAGRVILAGIKYTANGFQNVENAQYHKRLLVCATCDRNDNGKCLECGCFLSIKAKMATEKCPLNKWDLPNSTKNAVHGDCECSKNSTS